MIINPIIPIWVMAIICILFLLVKRKGKMNYVRQILIVILLFVINLRFMVRDGDVPSVMPKVDVVFVVDNTLSMLAEDYNGKGRRVDAVKADCQYIVEQFPGASFSLVTFDNTVQRRVPYTVDANMVIETIGTLRGPSEYSAKGTSFNEAMEFMGKMLDDDRNNYRIVFFISDGEIVSGDPLKSYSELSKFVDEGAVLGYGTAKGAPMKPIDYMEDEKDATYLYYDDADYNQKLAISKIDEGNLKSIASDLGVDYIHMEKQSDVHSKIKELQKKSSDLDMTEDMESKEGYADIYYWFVIPLLLLFVWDYVSTKKKVA